MAEVADSVGRGKILFLLTGANLRVKFNNKPVYAGEIRDREWVEIDLDAIKDCLPQEWASDVETETHKEKYMVYGYHRETQIPYAEIWYALDKGMHLTIQRKMEEDRPDIILIGIHTL